MAGVIVLAIYIISIFGARFAQRIMCKKYSWELLYSGVNFIPIINTIMFIIGIIGLIFTGINFSNNKIWNWFDNKDLKNH